MDLGCNTKDHKVSAVSFTLVVIGVLVFRTSGVDKLSNPSAVVPFSTTWTFPYLSLIDFRDC